MAYNFTQNTHFKFVCELCDFKSNKKNDYNRHLETIKHRNVTKSYNYAANIKKYECLCGKSYKHRQNLYKHKKKCDADAENICKEIDNDKISDKELVEFSDIKNISDKTIIHLINQNKELLLENKEIRTLLMNQQSQISELIPKVGNNNNNTINKQKFNINLFLNEQCKDAITMNKFIDNIKVTLEDLFVTKNRGISEGISNIFIKNMNKLSLYERPIHCTDVKRETLYIKSETDNGSDSQWKKDKEKHKLKKAIDDIICVQSKNLKLYTDEHPDWMNKEDKQEEYMVMVKNCLDNIKENNREDKVIKKMCNNVYLKGDDV